MIVGICVDRGHETALQPKGVPKYLHHRGQTVRRTRGVGQHMVARGIVLVVVDAHDDGQIHIFGGSTDNNLLRSLIQVFGRGRPVGEASRALEYNVHAHLAPRKHRDIRYGQKLDGPPLEDNLVVRVGDILRPDPMYAVIFEQMSHGSRVREVVHGYHFKIGPLFSRSPKKQPPDPSETVNSKLDAHLGSSLSRVFSTGRPDSTRSMAFLPSGGLDQSA